MRPYVLSQHLPLPTFPRLELAIGDDFKGLLMLASLVVEGAKLNSQIIALSS
jgi:hypothetical protein